MRRGGATGTKLLPSLGILLVTGGILLLVWFAWLWFNPGPAPYRYQLVKKAASPNFRSWAWTPGPTSPSPQYEVYTEGVDQPLATGHTARRGQGAPVLLDWENRTSELLVSVDSKLTELAALSAAIAKHAPKDALILAWWDTSRQINLLSGRDTLFTIAYRRTPDRAGGMARPHGGHRQIRKRILGRPGR